MQDATRQDMRDAKARGVRDGREMLRGGSSALDVMRESWSVLNDLDPRTQAYQPAGSYAKGLQDAVAHDRRLYS